MILADDFAKYKSYTLVGGVGKEDFLLIGSYSLIWKGLKKGYSLNRISHEYGIPLKIVYTRTQDMLKSKLVKRKAITSRYVKKIAEIDEDKRGRIKYNYFAIGYEKRGFEAPYIDVLLVSWLGILGTFVTYAIVQSMAIFTSIVAFFIIFVISVYQKSRFCLKL